MAETQSQPQNLIEAGDELEGAIEPNEDFVFVRIGASLPLTPSHSPFDLHSPPSHPLALSHRHHLILLAHSHGFLVAKTKDVIELAKEVKEDGRSVESVSVVDVKVGGVKVLAVSGDEMVVAAAVGGDMFFFFVDSLIGKVEEPAFSCSLVDGGNVKDFRWQKNMRKSFLVLSTHGSLYHGVLKAPLTALMDNVDAVDWSRDGDFIAVAKNQTITILSSSFKELLSFSLFFQSWLPPESSECTMKVDSVKWVRDDCIIIGCFQVNEHDDDEGYNIQIITSKEDKLSEASSKPIVYSFSDLFDGVWDVLPRGCGPYLLESLLDSWDVILASNQKATDNHILLFSWSIGDKRKEVAMLDFTNDKYRPIIDLQENGNDNLLLGLGVDKFSTSEKVRIQIGTRFEELPSRYVLLCLTSEGKLVLYHAARISEPSASPQTCFSLHDDQDASEKHSKPSSLECFPTKSEVNDDEDDAASDRLKQINTKTLNAQKDAFDFQGKTVSSQRMQEGGQTGNLNKLSETAVIPRSPFSLQTSGKPFGGDIPNAQPSTLTSNISIPGRPFGAEVKVGDGLHAGLLAGQTGNLNKLSETPIIPRSQFGLQSTGKSFGGDISNAQPAIVTSNISIPGRPFGAEVKVGDGSHVGLFTGQTENLDKLTMVTPQRSPFGLQSTGKSYVGDVRKAQPSTLTSNMSIPGKPFGGDVPNAQSSIFTSNESVPTAQEKSNLNKSSSEFMSSNQSFSSKDSNKQSPLSIYYSSQAAPSSKTQTGDSQLMPTVRGSHESAEEGSLLGSLNYSMEQPLFEDIRASKFPLMVSSEPDMWKQYSVEDLVQDLDILLSSIEKEKGFEDACTSSHKSSLLEIEDCLEALSGTARQCKKNIEEQLMKVQQLQNKMLLVSTRKDYMKGIVEQASNKVYWDLWDRQKLNSEFDAKWNSILSANQNLTNHIIELEKHFNTIEINKFCDSGRISSGRSTFQSDVMPSRIIKSLQSVYNTLNSQLAAAEHLSKCLSKQMSELNLSSAPVKRQSTKEELFESIGFSHEISALQSPYFKRPKLTPDSVMRTPPPSKTSIAEKFSSVAKISGPDTARRRRDSLDRNRTSFVPPKMTVQRTVQERSRVTADKPFRKAKEAFDSQLNEFTKQQRSNTSHPSSSLKYHRNEGAGERHREHLAEAQSSYVSARAKGISPSALKERTDFLPPLMSPSLSAFSSPQCSTKEVFASPDKLSVEHTPVGTNAISSFRTVSDVQFETSSSLQTALTFSSSMSPLNTKLLVKPTDARSLNFRSEGNITTHSASKSSPNSRPSVENDNSISSFSTPPDITSVGLNKSTASFDKVTSKNQSSGSIFNLVSDPQNPVLTPPSPGPFSFSTASAASTSLSTTSQATISFGKSSSGAKPVGVTKQRKPVSTVASTANSQFLPSSILFSQSLNSADPTNTPIKPTLTLGVPSSDAKSFGESDQMGSIPLPEKSFPVTDSSLSTTLPSENRSVPTLPVTSASTVDSVNLNKDSSNDQPPTTQSAVFVEVKHTLQSEKNLNATDSVRAALAASDPQPQMPSSAALLMSSATTKKNEELDLSLSQEDEMEEEAVDTTTVLSLGALGGFGLGSSPALSSTKPNPFGAPLFPTNNSSTANTQATSFTVSPGEPFRAASFTLPPAPNPVQLMSQQPASSGGFPSGLGGGGLSGFGQPSHVGVGQQALGSVLGAFGQSRQPGVLPEVGFPSSTAFGGGGGGFSSASTGKFPAFGGFAGASAGGGGFTSVASPSSGFATAAKGIGGFAGVSSGVGGGFAGAGGGGFGSVATNSGFAGVAGGGFGSVAPNSGFASAAPGGVGGFGGAATAASGFTSGGFAAFGSSQGGAFSAFGQNSAPGSGKPPATLLTQMRK